MASSQSTGQCPHCSTTKGVVVGTTGCLVVIGYLEGCGVTFGEVQNPTGCVPVQPNLS